MNYNVRVYESNIMPHFRTFCELVEGEENKRGREGLETEVSHVTQRVENVWGRVLPFDVNR